MARASPRVMSIAKPGRTIQVCNNRQTRDDERPIYRRFTREHCAYTQYILRCPISACTARQTLNIYECNVILKRFLAGKKQFFVQGSATDHFNRNCRLRARVENKNIITFIMRKSCIRRAKSSTRYTFDDEIYKFVFTLIKHYGPSKNIITKYPTDL